MTTATVRLAGIYPYPTQMSGETFTVQVDGKTYKVEKWATDNSSGLETYNEDDTPAFDVPEEVDEALSDAMEKWGEVFYAKWNERVDPIIQQIVAECIAECEPLTVEVDS